MKKILAKLALGLLVIVLFAGILPTAYSLKGPCPARSERPLANDLPQAVIEAKKKLSTYERGEAWTYLTIPEWYVVYSSEEYAQTLLQNHPSDFPYFASIKQFWNYYHDANCHIRGTYSFDTGYNVLVFVVGTSFTVENTVKGIYEKSIGRLTELLARGQKTEEDLYAAQVARDYGTFLHTIPWYQFPFSTKLAGLWSETSLFGPKIVRKWERKAILSTEYGLKSIYGWLIKQGTGAAYEAERLTIQAFVTAPDIQKIKTIKNIEILEALDENIHLIELPRYEAFTKAVPRLVNLGVEFIEIAGNDEILITALTSQGSASPKDAELLFSYPLLTSKGRERQVLRVSIPNLHKVTKELSSSLEHIYDY